MITLSPREVAAALLDSASWLSACGEFERAAHLVLIASELLRERAEKHEEERAS